MKLYQAVTISEEVQTLHERATVLPNMYFLLQPSPNYFLSSKLKQITTTLPLTPLTPSTPSKHASHNMRDESEISGSHSGIVEGSIRLAC
jgi:hypothetical protein